MKTVKMQLAFRTINESSSRISKLIGLWTRSKFSHVEIIIDGEWISSIENIGVRIGKREINDDWVIVDLPDITIAEATYDKINLWIQNQVGKPYDVMGIVFTHVIPLRLEARGKWSCSELGTKIMQMYTVMEVMDLTPHMVSPGKLAKIYNLE